MTAKNLIGRRVAGREFLDAYFRHGRWGELMALVANQPSAKSIQEAFDANPAGRARGRRLRVVAQQEFHRAFFPDPPAPCCTCPDRWMRAMPGRGWHGGPGSFAISGVTYTICSQAIAQAMCEMVTAPYESYDALICASRVARRRGPPPWPTPMPSI